MSEQLSGNPGQVPYTPTTEEALYCSQCWADLKLYPPATELVFERDFTVNTETVRKVYRYVRTDATEFDRWLAEVKAQEARAERKRAMSIIMTNIGQIVWQARHNPEGQAIDTSKMLKEIMGIDDE